MTPQLSDLVQRLSAAGRISADDVLAMRRAVYGAPKVSQDDVAALIALDSAARDVAPEWSAFLAEAMVDCAVHQADPEDYVDDDTAIWLQGACAGALRKDGAVAALVAVLDAALGVPPPFEAFVRGKAKAALIAGGPLTAADVALLRRLVFAAGGEDNVGVTRDEADLLFDVDAAAGEGADAAWPDFFAQAVDDALTAVSPVHAESRDDAVRDEAWLASRPGVFGFLKSMLHAPAADPSLGAQETMREEVQDIFHSRALEAREWQGPEAKMEADEAAAAVITDDKAQWLMGRRKQGPLTPAGRRLIQRLKGEVDPSGPMKPLFDAA